MRRLVRSRRRAHPVRVPERSRRLRSCSGDHVLARGARAPGRGRSSCSRPGANLRNVDVESASLANSVKIGRPSRVSPPTCPGRCGNAPTYQGKTPAPEVTRMCLDKAAINALYRAGWRPSRKRKRSPNPFGRVGRAIECAAPSALDSRVRTPITPEAEHE